MCGQPILLHLLVCIFYVLHWDIISQTNFKITKVFLLLLYFNKTRALVLFLRFPYLNYKTFINDFKFVWEFQSVYSSGFVRRYWSGPCTIYVVRFSPIVFNIGNKRFIIVRLTMRCMMNCLRESSACWQIAYTVKHLNIANSYERMNRVQVY